MTLPAASTVSPDLSARRRRVVVSGGGTGIGRAIAARFAASGDAVTILGRRASVLARTADDLSHLDGEVVPRDADLTDATAVAAVAEQIASHGPVQVLVHAAGGLASVDSSGLTGIEEGWRTMLAGNLLPPVLLTEALREHLSEQARVISIGSIAGSTGAGSYGAAKAGLIAWNTTLAGQLAATGGTANVIAPGYVTDTEFFGQQMSPERHDRLVGKTLLGRAGQPDDIAGAAAFLASEDAAWITGQVLHVNGGALLSR